MSRRLPASPYAPSAVRVVYEDGRGILRRVLETCTSRDFKVASLAADLNEIDGVHAVHAGDVNEIFD